MGTADQDMVIKLRSEMDSAIKEVKRLSKELDSLNKQTTKNTKGFKQNEAAYKRIGASVTKLTKQLGALALAYASIQGAKQLISTTAEVEKGFIGIAKTTGLTTEEFKKLESELLSMSTEMAGVSIEGLQAVAETAGRQPDDRDRLPVPQPVAGDRQSRFVDQQPYLYSRKSLHSDRAG